MWQVRDSNNIKDQVGLNLVFVGLEVYSTWEDRFLEKLSAITNMKLGRPWKGAIKQGVLELKPHYLHYKSFSPAWKLGNFLKRRETIHEKI